MKVTVEIDCTPAEARRLMGLPDFEPLQQAIMEHLEKATFQHMAKLSPEGLLHSWLSAGPANLESIRDMMTTAFARDETKPV